MRRIPLAVLLAGLATGAAQAAEPKTAAPADAKVQPVDAELLEFLGSLDAEEEGWREYLEERPMKAEGKPEPRKAAPGEPDPKKLQQVKKP